MEPRGCNRWQSVANPLRAETTKTSQIRCHRLPPVACDGNEGVDGSSPSEGFAEFLLISPF
jgi:hypothetical protein